MPRHELRRPPRKPWVGRGPLLALSGAVVVLVPVLVYAGPTAIYGAPIVGGIHLVGPVAGPADPFPRS